ncbi:pimeloyl-ACP methyl ester carboxylesterase [Streptomyces sp. V4I23]|uniref:alpha/beta fold hydrolase n=1 Tax=Streptomyces sp. V4I23 TaxID=3042282 RepID=UPI00277F1C2B|nr:alpha/beta hydrolase [Streptomyces sp. V4I23]MDQ1007406.1 pimeloyl-ACP methyl ester carboxylesterase [Streptomyces sp. V4I23]
MHEFVYTGSDDCSLHAAVLGCGLALILLHGGGADCQSLLPVAHRLADTYTVVLPHVRGYGRSVCVDPARHTWAQYVDDVGVLMDHLGLRQAALGGSGLGGTITLRAALAYPQRLRAAVVISVEGIEDDEGNEAEAAMLESFAIRVITGGVEAAWAPFLPHLAPVIGPRTGRHTPVGPREHRRCLCHRSRPRLPECRRPLFGRGADADHAGRRCAASRGPGGCSCSHAALRTSGGGRSVRRHAHRR